MIVEEVRVISVRKLQKDLDFDDFKEVNVDLEKDYDDVREEKGNVFFYALLKKYDDDLEEDYDGLREEEQVVDYDDLKKDSGDLEEEYDNLREQEQDVDCDDLKKDNDALEEYYDDLKEEVENYDNDALKKDNDPVIQSSLINEVDKEYLEWAIISLFDDNGTNSRQLILFPTNNRLLLFRDRG